MNDKLIMENYLLVLKSTVEVYVHGTLESSNKKVREILHENLNNTIDHQGNTYNEMVKREWYTVSNIGSGTVKKVLKQIENN